MIHQCFFSSEQAAHLFTAEPYQAFGLEPAVNPQITRNCPELEVESCRMALAEYAAMLHHWRNPELDSDAWIGFTSYRQFAKSPVMFQRKDAVEALLCGGDFVTWYMWWIGDLRLGTLRGAAAQAEANHPGIHQFIIDVLAMSGLSINPAYEASPFAPFANYWAMPRPRFEQFMQWSWPIVSNALVIDHPYLKGASPLGEHDNKARAVGYFMERLFVLWTHQERLRPVVVGHIYGWTGQPLDQATLARLGISNVK